MEDRQTGTPVVKGRDTGIGVGFYPCYDYVTVSNNSLSLLRYPLICVSGHVMWTCLTFHDTSISDNKVSVRGDTGDG